MKKWFSLVAVALLLVGCNIGNFEEHNQQTVLYGENGSPVLVLDKVGNYVAIDAASDELLAMRGLIRTENGVVPE